MTDDFVAPGEPERVAGVLELIRARADIPGLRVLDLACRTGAFSTALANAGAEVLGIEGRPENFNRIPSSSGARFELGDVRDLSVARHGTHDVTLCLGILYHLDAEDALRLLAAMRQVTTGFAIIDTHVGVPATIVEVAGREYLGHWYGEPPGLWSSIGNPRSFWFTPESLDAAVYAAGWATIEHLPGVRHPAEPAGRHWLVVS
jgi:SAM-dependent methyltransferase